MFRKNTWFAATSQDIDASIADLYREVRLIQEHLLHSAPKEKRTIKKAKKRPANGVNGGFEWGSYNHKELARLFNEGNDLSYMAAVFGRSENAVEQQITKLKKKGLI